MRVLVVEDEEMLNDVIARGLRQQGMAVDTALDGADALRKSEMHAYDVVILDRDLPGIPGDEVCRRLVGGTDAPRVIMLTASTAIDDRVEGLTLGADDYLGKPFAFPELVARIQALNRRPSRKTPPRLERKGVTLDSAAKTVERDGAAVSLRRKEFGVLQMLLEADGAVVSAEELLEHVWDAEVDPFSNIVSVTMARLRRKLGDPPLIETVAGAGYRIA